MKRKRFNILFTLMISLLLIYTNDVFAQSRDDAIKSVNNKSKIKLCEYSEGDNAVEVYFDLVPAGSNTIDNGKWQFFYEVKGKWKGGSDIFYGKPEDVLSDKGRIHFQEIEKRYRDGANIQETNYYCTKYAFIDTANYNELCFTDSYTCGTNMGTTFSHGPYSSSKNGSTIFESIHKYATVSIFENSNFKKELKEEIKKGNNPSLDIIKKYTENYITIIYSMPSKYKEPSWLKNYIQNLNEHIQNNSGDYDTFMKNYNDLIASIKSSISQEVKEEVEAGTMTEEEGEEIKQNAEEAAEQEFNNVMSMTGGANIKQANACPDCNSLLGSTITKLVNNIFKTIQYAGPILVVALTTIEFIKAAAIGTQDELKKSSKRFAKRAIAAVLLFFIPIICNALFEFAGITLPQMCIGSEVIEIECVEN